MKYNTIRKHTKKSRKAKGNNAKKLNERIIEALLSGNIERYKTLIKRAEKRGYKVEGIIK